MHQNVIATIPVCRAFVIIILFCTIVTMCFSCDQMYSNRYRDSEFQRHDAREEMRRTDPVGYLKMEIRELKEEMAQCERLVKEWEELVQEAAAPDCDLRDCETELMRRTDRVEHYKEQVAHQKKLIREKEREIAQLEHSQDGSNSGGSGGSSGGGHSW